MKNLRDVVVGVFVTVLVLLAGQAFGQSVGVPVDAALRVDGFDVERVQQLSPGVQLNFTLFGTPGGETELHIDGTRAQVLLAEVQTGVYEGSYTITEQDRIAPDSRVTAQLRIQDRAVTSVLEEPLLLGRDGSAPSPAWGETGSATVDRAVPAVPYCPDCGIVEAIDKARVSGSAGPVGAITGGVLGAIVGGLFGDGEGRRAARILGAMGGAYAGHEIERSHSSRTRYDVVVRMRNGTRQALAFDTAPPFKVGDQVRLTGGSARPYR
jgi:outer membrane lipoprotein SlyB